MVGRRRKGVYSHIDGREIGVIQPWGILNAAKDCKDFIQRLGKWRVLAGHEGCVNTVAWNEAGDKILTGSDDCRLNVYHVGRNQLLHSIRSGHRANIFSAKFLPHTSDRKVVSCCGSGMIFYNEIGIETLYGHNYFNCHGGTTYEVAITPGDPNTFLTCGEDGTVRNFDLRKKSNCFCQECREDIIIEIKNAVTSVTVNPMVPYQLAIGSEDSTVRIFDTRQTGPTQRPRFLVKKAKQTPGMLCCFKPPQLEKGSYRVTSLKYSNDGEEILTSYCTDYVYLFSMKEAFGQLKAKKLEKEACNGGFNGRNDEKQSSSLPPMKRLRLRGDWSDTGPNSRPETEQEPQDNNNSSLMQRIYEVFSQSLEQAFNESIRSRAERREEDEEARESPSAEANQNENNSSPRREDDQETEASSSAETIPYDNHQSPCEEQGEETGESPSVERTEIEHGTCLGEREGGEIKESQSIDPLRNVCCVVSGVEDDENVSMTDVSGIIEGNTTAKHLEVQEGSCAVRDTREGTPIATHVRTSVVELNRESSLAEDTSDRSISNLDCSIMGSQDIYLDNGLEHLQIDAKERQDHDVLTSSQEGSEKMEIFDEIKSDENIQVCNSFDANKRRDSNIDHAMFENAGKTPFLGIANACPEAKRVVDTKHGIANLPENLQSPKTSDFASMLVDKAIDESMNVIGKTKEIQQSRESTKGYRITESMTASATREGYSTNELSVNDLLVSQEQAVSEAKDDQRFDASDAQKVKEGVSDEEGVMALNSSVSTCSKAELKFSTQRCKFNEENAVSSHISSKDSKMFNIESKSFQSSTNSDRVSQSSENSEELSRCPKTEDFIISASRPTRSSRKADLEIDKSDEEIVDDDESLIEEYNPEKPNIYQPTRSCDGENIGLEFEIVPDTSEESKYGSSLKSKETCPPTCDCTGSNGCQISSENCSCKKNANFDRSNDAALVEDGFEIEDTGCISNCAEEQARDVSTEDAIQRNHQSNSRTLASPDLEDPDMRTYNDSPDSVGSAASTIDLQDADTVDAGSISESSSDEATTSNNNDVHSASYVARYNAARRIQRCFRLRRSQSNDCLCEDDILLILEPKMVFKGHRNARTMIKEANFWGHDYILSGSDCGRVFIWDKNDGQLVTLLEGDKHVVNCVQPHPFDPVLATSGIDYDVKIWSPVLPKPAALNDVDEIIRRNEQMLKESRDTITVPASFMLRMLASISRVRGFRRRQQDEEGVENESDDDD